MSVHGEYYTNVNFCLFDLFLRKEDNEKIIKIKKEFEDFSPRDAINAFIRTLIKDLELLLNTRTSWEKASQLPGDLSSTVIAYGLPDMGSAGIRNPVDRIAIRENIHAAITAFEPRLADVIVSDVSGEDVTNRLSFQIQGNLKIAAATVSLVLETQVIALTRSVEVKELRRGGFV